NVGAAQRPVRTDPALPRPAGRVTIVTVPSPSEKGGYFAPPPISPASTPPTLLWLSADALSTLTKARETGTIFKALPGVDSHPSLVQPSLEACAEFKVSPETHLGYSATWFSLSAAGIAMTRRLLRAVPK
ncbi:hypothetical protein TeGR_g10475, partial [Tetraparma gracilis]